MNPDTRRRLDTLADAVPGADYWEDREPPVISADAEAAWFDEDAAFERRREEET